jgi:putative FmdB family regulatory protein
VPLYEYQCKKCKHKFEKIQKFSDRPLKKCPECGGPLEKLLHAAGLQFKGAGWYVTDYGAKTRHGEQGASEKGASEKSASDKPAAEKETTGAAKDKHEAKPKKPPAKKQSD